MADLHLWINGMWIAILAFWLLAAAASRQSVRTQSQTSRVGQGLLTASGFIMMFNRQVHLGLLDRRVIPDSDMRAYAGVALTAIGMGFMIWSRVSLGRNWSATVTIKEGHELIHRGPYALVRHPIYSGALLAQLGTAIYYGELRGFVAVLLTFSGWWLKTRTEETFLVEQFGPQYRHYRKHVKALIPYVL
jgi:protein-S-isoprenylcysteine O-methyltransferase Ste14